MICLWCTISKFMPNSSNTCLTKTQYLWAKYWNPVFFFSQLAAIGGWAATGWAIQFVSLIVARAMRSPKGCLPPQHRLPGPVTPVRISHVQAAPGFPVSWGRCDHRRSPPGGAAITATLHQAARACFLLATEGRRYTENIPLRHWKLTYTFLRPAGCVV